MFHSASARHPALALGLTFVLILSAHASSGTLADARGSVGGGPAARASSGGNAAPTATEPPAPAASAPVQALLDEAGKLTTARKPAEALAIADRALATAREAKDPPGEARAHRTRALLLDTLQKATEALAAWEAAAAAWRTAGDGPSEVEAVCRQALLLRDPGAVDSRLAVAIARAREEMRRPLAAAAALHGGAIGFYNRRRLGETNRLWTASLAIQEKLVGPEGTPTLGMADNLSNLGAAVRAQGDPARAKEYHQRALAIREKLAPGSRDVADSLNNLGNVAWQQGDLAGAEQHYQRALAIREKLAGTEGTPSLEVAAGLNNLGLVSTDQGDLAGAKKYYQRALAIIEKLAGPAGTPSLDAADILNNLGAVTREQGNLAGAKTYHERALALQEKLAPGSLVVATSLNNLGTVAHAQGDLAGAKEYYRRAMSLHEKLGGPGGGTPSLDVARSLYNLGTMAWQQGDLAGAKEYYQRSLAIEEKLAPGSLAVAASLTGLGNVTMDQGDLARAKEYYQRSLAIKEKLAVSGDTPSLDVAGSLSNLGNVARSEGDLARAKAYHERALAIQEHLAPGSLAVAASLSNLGSVADDQGDPARAKEYFQRALAVEEKLAPGSLGVADTLHNLGLVARRQGNLAGAVESLRHAWELLRTQAQQVTGDEARRAFSSARADYSAKLQRALLARGERTAAVRVLEEGRAQALQQALAERGLERLANPEARAAHAAAVNAERIARATHGRVLDREERARALLAEVRSKPEAERAPLQAALDTAVKETETARSALIQRRLEAEAAWARVKATAPRDALAEPLPFDRARAALRPGELFLAYSVGEKETTLFLVPGRQRTLVRTFTLPLGEEGWKKEVRRFNVAVTDRFEPEATVRTRGRALAARLFPSGALARMRRARRLLLSPDGALWNLPFAALPVRLSAGGREQYLGQVKALVTAQSLSLYARAVAAGREPGARNSARLGALTVGGCLFSPAAVAEARQKAGRPLAGARPGGPAAAGVPRPATAPTTPASGPPLSPDPHAPPAAASASPTAPTAPAAPPNGGRPLAAPGPPGSGPASPPLLPAAVQVATRGPGQILRGEEREWPSLPYSGPEAAGVARLHGGRTLSGLGATEAEVRRQLGTARVLHLATHGRYHRGDVLLSGLILTQPTPGEPVTPATDGVLEAAEVLDPALQLQAEVVVLSACETGRGQLSRGEGLVGLTRCWQIAGARSVVASQWSVADESTRVLMLAFHRGLRAGLTKDEAMRRAMVEVGKTKEWAHPFYWAPFLVTGDPRARKE